MADTLREDIIKDCGHPKLKAKCLDLITKLRMEAAVLNEAKTGKAKVVAPPPQVKDARNYDDQGKELLGLDENG